MLMGGLLLPGAESPLAVLPYPMRRRLSRPRRAAPRAAWLRAAPAGLPRRAGCAASAVGQAWPLAGGGGGRSGGGGATRPCEFPIRTYSMPA